MLLTWLFQAKKEGGKKAASSGGWFGGWLSWGSKETSTPNESQSVSKYRHFAVHCVA